MRSTSSGVILALLLHVLGRAEGACDRVAELARRVRSIEPRAEVALSSTSLRVLIRSPEGPILAERALGPTGSCEELAEVALTLIQAWQTTLPPLRLAAPRLLRTRKAELELGAGVAATISGRSYSTGGLITLLAGPRGGYVRARIAIFGATPHEVPIGDGVVRYGRVALSLGPVVTFRPSRLVIDLRGELALALLVLQSVGFAETRRAFDVDPAIGGGVRLGVRLGAVLPFLDMSAYGFLRTQRVFVDGVNDLKSLPRFEGVFSLGIAGNLL